MTDTENYDTQNSLDVRPKDSTDKAMHEQIKVLKHKKRVALASVTRCRNQLVSAMTDDNNLHNVKAQFEKYNELYEIYYKTHCDYSETLLSESDVETEIKSFQDKQNCIIEFRRQVMDWIKQSERNLTEDCESASKFSSHSHRSKHSHQSRYSKGSRSSMFYSLQDLHILPFLPEHVRKLK